MKKLLKLSAVIAAISILILNAQTVFACTSLGIGKDASEDGSVMVSHTCDGWYDQRIIIIPGGDHEEGEMLEIFNDPCLATRPDREPIKVGEIPQAEKTYTYFHVGYPFMNEKQLMISEYTWSGRDEVYNPKGMFVIANLEELALSRAANAREAIQVMGELAEQYGYNDGGETLIIGDPNEVWIFEVCGGGPLWTPDSEEPGAIWAARRIPDDEVFVGANRSRLGIIDFDDNDNFMWSEKVTALPLMMGWWEEGDDFNFSEIFNPEPYGAPFYQSRREWRVFSLLAPSQDLPVLDEYEHYPFSIKPDEKVSVKSIMDIYSDHYEGTKYDLTQDKAAGAFHNPTRWSLKHDLKPEYAQGQDWERSIALFRCSYSFVSQSRNWMPDPVGGVLWFGQDSPDTTVYVPIYCGATEVPEEWSSGIRHEFDPNSSWWAFNLVNNWANLRWDMIYEEIRAKKAELEQPFFDNQAAIEEEAVKLYEENPAKAEEFVTKYSNEQLNMVNEEWWKFAWHLIGKYHDGYALNEDGSISNPGYSTEYLEEVDFGYPALDDLKELGRE